MYLAQLVRYNKAVVFCFLICFSTIYIWFHLNVNTIVVFEDYSVVEEESDNFLINTEGCVIPNLEPFDSSIKEYIFKEAPVTCNNGTPALISSNLTSIYLMEDSFPFYNITNQSSLMCCYNTFWRVQPKANARDNNVEFSKECVLFKNSTDIMDEFIQVKCFYNINLIYNDFFAFIPSRNENKTSTQEGLNVLVVGLDGISKLNLIRQMPKTIKALKTLKSVEFLGYNKVDDNTFPNLIPVLTGFSQEELRGVCWPTNDARFDDCPFIWKKFKQAGFKTVFAEDASWMGLFNYERRGFLKQPTDHYWGYFNYNALRAIGNNHRMNVDQCMGATEDYMKLLEYTERFVESMHNEGQNYFGFFWQSSLSHDFLNKPNLGDDNYSSFLLRLQENGYLQNTALIFMSDHGIRWGDIRSTFQGSMEERLPFLYISLPFWYKDKFPEAYLNLVQNTRRLTTPFDLHDTLADLLNPFVLNKNFLTTRSTKINSSNRSQSLFNVVPKSRTCDSAGISAHFCTCQKSEEVDIENDAIKKIANFSVDNINNKLTNYSECVVLELVEIMSARVQIGSDKLSLKSSFTDFTVIFKTTPGDGIFEATVRKKGLGQKTRYETVGSTSRLNLYGGQSFCMDDFHLKLFCYCRQLIMSG